MSDTNKTTPITATDDGRWTEIELLPGWEEAYYDVYTARKLGKWVMFKTLKPAFRDDPAMRQMFDREFEVRYNLSHPNIVMVNDYEDIPGIGRCIITDDVYGDSLAKLLANKTLTRHHYEQLRTRLPMAMEYIQLNHIAHRPITPETIIFTDGVGNLKLIDVGFDQKRSLSHTATNDDIVNYGHIMTEVLETMGWQEPAMRHVADRASRSGYKSVQSLIIDINGRSYNKLYVAIIIFLTLLVALLAWMQGHA